MRAYNYAVNTQTVCSGFAEFCKTLFNARIWKQQVKRSTDEYIKNLINIFKNRKNLDVIRIFISLKFPVEKIISSNLEKDSNPKL